MQRHPEKHVFGVVDRSEEVKEILEDKKTPVQEQHRALEGARSTRRRRILHRHGAHFINYHGSWVVEELEGLHGARR